MGNQKFDRVELSRLLRSGKSQKEVAKLLGVSGAAVSKAKRELNIQVVRTAALEDAHKVMGQNLDALSQLNHINECAMELLDLLMRWNRGEDEALQVLESQVRKIKVGKGETAEEITQYRFKDPRELALKAMAEIRGQLSLQLEIYQVLTDMRTVQQFQREVLEAIGAESPETRDRIVRKLKNAKALRNSVGVSF